MLFPRLLSGTSALDRALAMALFGLAAAALLAVTDTDQAFAELSSTQLQDAASHTFSRSITDSVSVASNFGDLGARIPRVFNVGISDGLTITTSPTSPAGNTASPARGGSSFTGAGRAEERLGPRNPFESRGDLNNTSTVSSTTEESSQEGASFDIDAILSMVSQELFSSDDSEPDDNSPQTILLQSSPTMYMDALYGAYGLAVIVLATSKTNTAKAFARRIEKRSGTSRVTIARTGRAVVLVASGMVAVVAMSGGMTGTFAASPVPTYVGAGTTFNSASSGTVALPGSLQEDDILLLVIETANQAISVTDGGSAGTWTEIPDSPQGANGGTLATSTRLTVFWARYPGTGTTGPTISAAGNHQIAAVHAFRGVATSGDPFDVTSGNVETTSDTSLSATGDTTTVENTLVVILASLMDDAQNFGATWTNTDLTNITVRNNFLGTAGNDGRAIVVTGEKASIGSYGATTNTLSASSVKSMMTIALRPPPPGPPTLSISQPDGTSDTVSRNEPYTITYTLSDPDDDVTAAFYYDTDNSGLDGTAISGACATAAEGSSVTCEWDTTGLVAGTYYVYGIADDGLNPAVSAYSPGALTIDRSPFFFGAGAASSAAGAITPALPSSIEEDDILLLFVETANEIVTISNQNGGTWTEVTDSSQGTGTAGGTTSAGISVFWSRYNGVQDDPTVADSGNHNLGIILAFRGVIDTGDPWDVTSGNVDATSDTSLSATGDTTTAANTLVVIAAALMDDAQNFGGTWTNADLSTITVRANEGTSAGNDGRLGVVTGKKTAAGTYGATTNTLTASSVKGMMTIALAPLPASRSISDSLTVAAGLDGDITGVGRSMSEIVTFDVDIQASSSRSISTSSTVTITDSIDSNLDITPDSNVAGMAYASSTGNGLNYPKYREWNPTTKTWGSEVELETAGSPVRTAWIEFSPVSTKRVIIALSEDGTLDSYACDFGCNTAGNWAVNHDIVDLWSTAPAIQKRPFDMEFENTSGDLVLAYFKTGNSDPDADIFYRIMPDSQTVFGSESSLNDTGSTIPSNVYSFIRLDARRTTGSNDLGMIALSETNNRSVAWYWDGTNDAFGNELTLSTSMSLQIDYEAVGIGFETFTGDMVAAAGEGSTVVAYEFSGGSWGSEMTVSTLSIGTVKWIRFVANQNPGTTAIQLAASGSSGGLDSAVWSGTAWTGYAGGTRHDATIDSTEIRAFDWAWDNAGDATRGVLMWSSSSGVISYKRYTLLDTWTATKTLSDDGATHGWVSLNEHFNPTSADAVSMLGAAIDADSDISQLRWDGSANEPHAWLDDGATTEGRTDSESFHVDFRRSPVLKKFPQETVAVTDSLNAQVTGQVISTALTVTDSLVAEKGSPTDSSRFGAVYRSNTGGPLLNSPKYREWDPEGQGWSDEVVLPNTGSPVRDALIRFSPDSSLRVVVSHSDSGALNLFVCDSDCTSESSWTLLYPNFADTGTPVSSKPYRPYDIMFETTGERLIIVYDKELTETADFYYRTFDGTTLSGETGVDLEGAADAEDLRHLSLAAHPTTNEMALAVLDATNSDSYGVIWDGSAWGNTQTISTTMSASNIDGDSVGVAYETSSGAALVFSGNGQNSAAYARWTGSWSPVSTTNPNTSVTTEDIKFVSLKADPSGSSSDIMVCQSDDESDLTCAEFVAGSPGTWNTITSNTGTTAGRAFDFAYHPSNGKGMLVSSSAATGTLDYRVWNGTNFGGNGDLTVAGTHKWVFGLSASAATDVVNGMFLKSNSNFDTGAIKYKADLVTLVGDSALTSDSFNDTFESMHMDIQRSKVVRRAISDTVTIADSAAGEFTTGRLVTDTLTVADAITKSTMFARSVSDSASITDSAAKAALRLVSDSLAVSDAATRTYSPSKSASETLAVADSLARNVASSRSTGIDSLTITDGIVTTKSFTRAVAETVTLADEITRNSFFSASVSDAAAFSDSVARTLSAARSASDTLTLTDAVAVNTSVNRSISEALDMSDAIARNSFFTAALSDTATVSDAVARTHVASRSISETVSASDAIARSVSRSVSDSVSLSDAITLSVSRSLSDALAIADTIAKSVSRSISDTLAVTEEIGRNNFTSASISDTLAVSDSVARTLSAARSTADTLSSTDAIVRGASRAVADSVSVADAITTDASRSVSDSLSATDAVAMSVTRSITDALTLTEEIERNNFATGSLSETITVSDAIAATLLASRPISDTVSIADEITRNSFFTAALSDTVVISDSIDTTLAPSRSVAEAVTVTDAISAAVSRSLSDSASITDAIAVSVSRSIAESLAVTDAITRSVSRTITDALSITDVITTDASRSVSDALSVADSVSTSVTRTISDSVIVADTIGRSASYSLEDSTSITDIVAMHVSRSVADSLAVTDAVTPSTIVSVSENVTVADSVDMSVTRSLAETLAVVDAISPTAIVSVADLVGVADAVSTSVTRAIADSATIADAITTAVTRSIADSLAVTDAISGSPQPSINESLSVEDAIAMSVTRAIADVLTIEEAASPESDIVILETVAVEDSVSMHVTRALADEVVITDVANTGEVANIPESLLVEDAISTSVTRSIDDAVTVEDSASKSIAVNISDSLGTGDGVTAYPGYAVSISETITIGDLAERPLVTARSAEEMLAITDAITANVSYARAAEETVTIGDLVSINGAVVIPESLSVVDIISMHVTRTLADEVSIADVLSPPQPTPQDSIGIADAITNIVITWNRTFDEDLTLADCGPFSCNHIVILEEGLSLSSEFGDGKVDVADTVVVSDAITPGLRVSPVPPVEDSVTFADSVTAQIIGILVVDDTYAIGELPSTEVTGNYTYTGDAEDLVDQLDDAIMLPIPINSTVLRPNLPTDITILRTFYVPMTPTAEIPGDDVIVSEVHEEVPAYSNMFMRINFEETPALAGIDFISTLDIEFTPAVDSTDFALVVSLMDGPPGAAPTPAESLRPIYIDVRWVGDFPGVEDPSVQEYYENPPTFTFTVNQEWVEEQSANTDTNGVPLLKLWLLNDAGTEWEQITTIARPTEEIDGTYTFVATLPHFSDYAITANTGGAVGGGGGGGSDEEQFVVNLIDALALSESSKGQAVEIIEEFVNEKFAANLLDSVVIKSRPVAYNTFQILKDVEVSITVVDVRQESVMPPSATAVLETLIENKGDVSEEFTLNFWYNDQTGERKFDLSLFVEVDPHESKTIPVEIPFTEPGTFRVTAEARGVPGNELLESTQLTVVIPWLAVYLYVLIAVAIAILGGSGAAIALYMARNATLIAAGAGAAGAVIILAKRHKPRVRVAEWKEGAEDDDYDLLVNVTLANGTEGRLKPGELAGAFEFEIINRSRSKQEFVLAYYLEDVAGMKVPETAGVVKIDKHKKELRRDRVTLPSRGAYMLWVEARTPSGEVLSRDRVAVRSI